MKSTLLSLPILLAGCASAPEPPTSASVDLAALADEVWETELAFAATMAERDLEAFSGFLSAEAIFFSGEDVLRGRAEVTAGWAPLFEQPEAPFAWEPDTVEVLESGTLALSSGPVLSPRGDPVGRFNSIWRREAGDWRVVFDKGDGG